MKITDTNNLKFWEEWLTSHGYSIEFDDDGLWAEDWIREHKWLDIFELMTQYASEVMEYAIQRVDAEKKKEEEREREREKNDPNLCCICHSNYVDSENGFDTCDYCAKNI